MIKSFRAFTVALFLICFSLSFFYKLPVKSSFDAVKCDSKQSERHRNILDMIIKSADARLKFEGEHVEFTDSGMKNTMVYCKSNKKFLEAQTAQHLFTFQYPSCFEQSDRNESVNWFRNELSDQIRDCKGYYKGLIK